MLGRYMCWVYVVEKFVMLGDLNDSVIHVFTETFSSQTWHAMDHDCSWLLCLINHSSLWVMHWVLFMLQGLVQHYTVKINLKRQIVQLK